MEVLAVIDRFESDKAILLLGNDEIQVVWPREVLPVEAGESDILTITLEINREATAASKAEAEKLLKELINSNKSEGF